MTEPENTPPPPPPAASTLDAKTLNLIMAADLANIVKKVKAGKPLSAGERELLESRAQASAPNPIPTLDQPKTSPNPSHVRQSKYHKATNTEIRRRIEIVARLIGEKQATKTEIHVACREQFNVHWRSADRYMVLARQFLLERHNKTREEVRSEAVSFNEGILRSDKTTIREKQEARRELNAIFGIYAPRQHQISTPPGQPAQIEDVSRYAQLPTANLLALLSAVATEPDEPAPPA